MRIFKYNFYIGGYEEPFRRLLEYMVVESHDEAIAGVVHGHILSKPRNLARPLPILINRLLEAFEVKLYTRFSG